MHIKQQKQIKTYLIEALGEDRGTTVFHKQDFYFCCVLS